VIIVDCQLHFLCLSVCLSVCLFLHALLLCFSVQFFNCSMCSPDSNNIDWIYSRQMNACCYFMIAKTCGTAWVIEQWCGTAYGFGLVTIKPRIYFLRLCRFVALHIWNIMQFVHYCCGLVYAAIRIRIPDQFWLKFWPCANANKSSKS